MNLYAISHYSGRNGFCVHIRHTRRAALHTIPLDEPFSHTKPHLHTFPIEARLHRGNEATSLMIHFCQNDRLAGRSEDIGAALEQMRQVQQAV